MDDKKTNREKPGRNRPTGQSGDNSIILKTSGLCKTFKTADGDIEILRGIDLEIENGAFSSIVGASGAGKSTLLYLLSGLDIPSKGTVSYGQTELSTLNENQMAEFRNRHIGFIYQFHYLLSEFSAIENVMMPGLIAGKNRISAYNDAYNILEQMNLTDRINHRPGKLSGGEQQRVAVARALVNSPDIVFADEPSGNLDEKTADNLHETMVEINKSTGVTFLIATHNLSLAEKAEKRYELSTGVLRLQ